MSEHPQKVQSDGGTTSASLSRSLRRHFGFPDSVHQPGGLTAATAHLCTT